MAPATMPTCISGLSRATQPVSGMCHITPLCCSLSLDSLPSPAGRALHGPEDPGELPALLRTLQPVSNQAGLGPSALSPVKTLHFISLFMSLCLLPDPELVDAHGCAQDLPPLHLHTIRH